MGFSAKIIKTSLFLLTLISHLSFSAAAESPDVNACAQQFAVAGSLSVNTGDDEITSLIEKFKNEEQKLRLKLIEASKIDEVRVRDEDSGLHELVKLETELLKKLILSKDNSRLSAILNEYSNLIIGNSEIVLAEVDTYSWIDMTVFIGENLMDFALENKNLEAFTLLVDYLLKNSKSPELYFNQLESQKILAMNPLAQKILQQKGINVDLKNGYTMTLNGPNKQKLETLLKDRSLDSFLSLMSGIFGKEELRTIYGTYSGNFGGLNQSHPCYNCESFNLRVTQKDNMFSISMRELFSEQPKVYNQMYLAVDQSVPLTDIKFDKQVLSVKAGGALMQLQFDENFNLNSITLSYPKLWNVLRLPGPQANFYQTFQGLKLSEDFFAYPKATAEQFLVK